jgi:uncharacterized protein YkwD
MLFHLKWECSPDKYRIMNADMDGSVLIFLEKILAVDSIVSRIILNGYRGIMYKLVSITIIMASAIAAALIVPWAALQRSHAQSDLADAILTVHNRERAAVSIPPLKWSDSLANEAKTWAEHLATTGKFEHETAIFPDKGENIAGFNPSKGVSAPGEGQELWVAEKSRAFETRPITDANLYPVGHYVQMVSPATAHVGCGTASGSGHPYSILVCRYDRSLFPKEPYIPSFLSRPAG